MSELSLSRKIEKVLSSYLEDAIDDVNLNVYEGHEKAATVEFPYLVCYAENSQPHPEMPSSTGVRIVALRLELRIDSEDAGARAALDEWRMLLEDALSDIGAIATFISASAIPWNGFLPYVYDVIPESEPTEFDNTDWVEQFIVGVVCQLTPVPVIP